jgi:tetratricopeptide (TPR) repeat protein
MIMKTELKNFALRGGMALAIAMLSCTSVYAQRAAEGDEEAAAPSNDIDAQTGKILSEAIELLNMDMFAEARARLADLRIDRLSPYEKSRLHQLLFNLEMNDEDYPGAREQLQLSIDSGGLNPQEIAALRYQMAQLFVQEEKYAEAATALENWIASEPMPNSAAYYLLAASYYYQELFDKALPNAEKAVELAGNAPQEGWLSMLASLLIQKEDYVAAIPVLKRMVNMFPDKKTYWQQLSGLYLQQEDYANALVVLEFANYGGMLTEGRELTQLADLYQLQEMPYRSASMLEGAIAEGKLEKTRQNYEKLGNAWTAAREFEKAVPVFRDAAELAEDGELYKRAGEVQQQLTDWEGSVESFEDAIEKGGLRDEAYVEYLLGYSLYQLKRGPEAKTHLERAARDADHRSSANSLIQVIDALSN